MKTKEASKAKIKKADTFAINIYALYSFEKNCNEYLSNSEFMRCLDDKSILTQTGKSWDLTGIRRVIMRGETLTTTLQIPKLSEATQWLYTQAKEQKHHINDQIHIL